MIRGQTISAGKGTTTGIEEYDLFEALTRGRSIGSKGVKLVDTDTDETIWLRGEKAGTIVVANDFRTWSVERGELTMKPQEPDEEFPSITTDTTSVAFSQERPVSEFIDLRPSPSLGVARILARAPEELRYALEWEKEHGALFDNLDELLGDVLPPDMTWEEWHAIIDEPYDPY